MKNRVFRDDYSIDKPALSEYEDVILIKSIPSSIHPYFVKINKKLQGRLEHRTRSQFF